MTVSGGKLDLGATTTTPFTRSFNMERDSALHPGCNPPVDAPKKLQILFSMAKLRVFMLPFLFNSPMIDNI